MNDQFLGNVTSHSSDAGPGGVGGVTVTMTAPPAESALTDLEQHIVAVPDFPSPGILFRDIAPLLRHRFGPTVAALGDAFGADEWAGIDVVVGIESRGFVLAAALAERFGKAFAPVRKQGKLPPPVVTRSYTLEYGVGVLEMQAGSGRVLLVDDVLATGGTLAASADLCEAAGYTVAGLLVLIDIGIAPAFSWRSLIPRSIVRY